MAEFQQNTSDNATKTEQAKSHSGLALDAVFSTLPELSSDQDVGSFAPACPPSPTAKEIICKEDIKLCNAQTSAEGSPRLERETQLLDHELMHCNGEPSIPVIPAELQENSSFGATDMSLPPMVDSVTNNMFKVSINQALSSSGEPLHQHTLENRGSGHTEHHEMSMVIVGGDVKADEPLSSNRHAAIVKADAPSLQTRDYEMGVKDGKPPSLINDGSELASDKDDYDINDNVDDEEEEADDSGIDIDDDDDSGIDIDDDDEEEEVDDSNSEIEQDSDSSSSTSSLSFLSSSDDDDEVANLHRLLNGANNQKDLVMEVESECEEGELKESPSQRKKVSLKKKTTNERSEDEDEEGLKEPVQSKNKTKDLPYVPKVFVTLEQYHKTVPVGFVSSVVGVSLIVEGIEGQQPLNEGSILWLTDQRLPLGIVDELFGPVKKPFYVVRYNDATEMPEGAKEGAQVSYVRDFADFVLNNPDIYSKGYDEAGAEDISDSEVDFSDDEKEAEYKRSKSRMKRGNSESSALEVDNRQHQEKRAEGKRLNKDNKNWRSRENARTFHSNNEFSGRPPRHQNARFQHHRSDREPPPFDNRVEPMQMSNQRNKHRRGNQSPVHQAQSQQSLGVGQSKSSTPESSTSDGTQPQVQPSKMNQLQSTSPQILQEPNQFCSTSQPIQTNQLRSVSQQAQPLQINPPRSFTQPTSQQVQPSHMNQPYNLMQSTSQQIQMNQPQGLMQSTLPQVLPWQSNQQQITPPQLSGIQHSQMPVYNHAVMAGQVAQVAIGGYGIPLANKPPLQPGTNTVQGLPPAYQSPIYQQQVPALNQFSSPMPHHFSGQGSQVLPNMGMPMGNQIQNVHANGYPVGVQPAALAAPVLGIPAGPANTPFNYSTQMVCNQKFSGFNPGCTPAFVNQSLPSTYGVPEQARTMQSMAGTPAASWQQQHSPQDSSGPGPQQPFQGPGPQQPFHQRPHFSDQRRGPYQGRRF